MRLLSHMPCLPHPATQDNEDCIKTAWNNEPAVSSTRHSAYKRLRETATTFLCAVLATEDRASAAKPPTEKLHLPAAASFTLFRQSREVVVAYERQHKSRTARWSLTSKYCCWQSSLHL